MDDEKVICAGCGASFGNKHMEFSFDGDTYCCKECFLKNPAAEQVAGTSWRIETYGKLPFEYFREGEGWSVWKSYSQPDAETRAVREYERLTKSDPTSSYRLVRFAHTTTVVAKRSAEGR